MASLQELRAQYPQYGGVSDGDFLFALRNKFYPDMHPRTFFDSIGGTTNAHVTIKRFKDEYREAVKNPVDGETRAETNLRLGGELTAPVGNPGSKAMQAARSALQGVTFGGGDEAVAGAMSLLTGRDYENELKRERDRLEIGREQSPVLTTTAEIGGAVALPGAALRVDRARPMMAAAKSAGAAGTGAAIYGFNAGEDGAQSRAENAAITGIMGGLLGAAAPAMGGLAERALNSRTARKAQQGLAKAAPDLDDLRARAGAIFDAADTKGLPTAGLPQAVQDVQSKIGRRPINPSIAPRASGVMGELEDIATSSSATVPFGELQDIRRLAGTAAADFSNPTEQRAAGIIQEGIDEFVEGVDPKLGGEISEARKMWSQLRKSEAIGEVIEKAKNQASGFENGLRIGIRQILNNKKRRAGFTKAELDAMNAIVQGTGFGNIMKKVGRLSFGMGQQTNVLSGVLGSGTAAGLGTAAMGPAGAVLGLVPPAVGYLGKRAAERTTEDMVKALQGLIVTGNQRTPQLSRAGRGILEELMRRSVRGQTALEIPEAASMLQSPAAQ